MALCSARTTTVMRLTVRKHGRAVPDTVCNTSAVRVARRKKMGLISVVCTIAIGLVVKPTNATTARIALNTNATNEIARMENKVALMRATIARTTIVGIVCKTVLTVVIIALSTSVLSQDVQTNADMVLAAFGIAVITNRNKASLCMLL